MDFRGEFVVEPGARVKLRKLDPAYTARLSEEEERPEIENHLEHLRRLQFLLYAERRRGLLVVLQGLDASGKDGTLRHVFGAMNPQGTTVTAFREPTDEELAHDFLWRVHPHAPGKGEVAIFNRSHYEDVFAARVRGLVPRDVWEGRYELINDFEKLLHRAGTHVVKFLLHISPEEQLRRFEARLDDPARGWKISEDDYRARQHWDSYLQAFEDALERTSTKHAPWYVIPADHKWFRNLAVSQIVAATLEDLGMRVPPPRVDLAAIRRRYHRAARRRRGGRAART